MTSDPAKLFKDYVDSLPNRFFEIYNALKEAFPSLPFKEADRIAREIFKLEQESAE